MPTPRRALTHRFLESGWLSIAMLVPLAINPWGQNVFSLPKATILRTVVVFLVAVWTVDRLFAEKRPDRPVARSPLVFAAAALLTVIGLATVFAQAPELSFWGSYGRSEGALTLVCFPILAVLLATRLAGVGQARRLFWTASATVLPLAVYAGFQLAGLEPLGVVTDARSSAFATLGRSNFLAAYVAMLLPLTLTLFVATRRPGARAVLGLLGILELALLIVTKTRAGWLAALVATCCWVALVYRHHVGAWVHRTWARTAAVGLAAVSIAAGLWLAQAGGSGAARLAIWQATQRLIVERPLLGYGPDSLGLVFARVYPPELVYHQGRGLVVDRAHNLLLDWTVTLGILGLFAGAAFLFVVATSGWRSLSLSKSNGAQQLLVVGALAALAGNLAGNLVSFDVVSTLALSSLLAGTVVALERGRTATATPRERPRGLMTAFAATVVCLAALLAAWAINVRPLAADVLARHAEILAETGDWQAAVAFAEKAAATFPAELSHHQRLGFVRLQRALQNPSAGPEAFAAAQRTLEEAVGRRPDDYLLAQALAEFHTAAAFRSDRRHLAPAEEAWQEAIRLAPNHGILYKAWGKLRLQAGDSDGAASLLRKAVDLDTSDAEAWLLLADLDLQRQRVTDALVEYRNAAKYSPDRPEPLVGLARVYWLLGQPEAAREALQEALARDPVNALAQAAWEEFSPNTPKNPPPPEGARLPPALHPE